MSEVKEPSPLSLFTMDEIAEECVNRYAKSSEFFYMGWGDVVENYDKFKYEGSNFTLVGALNHLSQLISDDSIASSLAAREGSEDNE